MDRGVPEDEEMTANELFRQRRLILGVGASYALCSMFGLTARADPAQRILAVAYDGPVALDPNVDHLLSNLQSTGAIVTWQRGPFFGTMSSLLQQGTYDQIWIWDLNLGTAWVSAEDKAALAAWWSGSAAHRNIVLDSRADGVFVQNDASEQDLCKNIVANLASRGGGLWIGAGYAPNAARTANAYLDALVADANQPSAAHFEGTYGNISTVSGSFNALLTTPDIVDAGGLAWSSFGEFGRSEAPASAPGIGALATVATDAEGHRLITTNIPEPTGFMGMGAGGAALFAARRRAGRKPGD